MKILLFPLFSLFFSCAPEPPAKNTHKYNLEWYTTFEENQLTITKLTENDTIFKTNKWGNYFFELNKGSKYHININQDKLEQTERKYTEIKLTDEESGKVLDSVYTDKCLKNYGYYINVN